MHDLIPITPLGGIGAESQEIEGISIREMPDFAYASISMRLGRKIGFRRATKKTLGILPPTPGKSAAIKAIKRTIS